MARAVSDLREAYPEITAAVAADNAVQTQLDRAARFLSPTAWATWYDDAVVMLAAHRVSLGITAAQSGAASPATGAVSQASVGQVSTSFAVPEYTTEGTKEETDLALTRYGREFMILRDALFAGGRLAGNTLIEESEI